MNILLQHHSKKGCHEREGPQPKAQGNVELTDKELVDATGDTGGAMYGIAHSIGDCLPDQYCPTCRKPCSDASGQLESQLGALARYYLADFGYQFYDNGAATQHEDNVEAKSIIGVSGKSVNPLRTNCLIPAVRLA